MRLIWERAGVVLTLAAVLGVVLAMHWYVSSQPSLSEVSISAAKPLGTPRQVTGPSFEEGIRGVRTGAAPFGQDPSEAAEY